MGIRSRVEIDMLFWLRPSFFSLPLSLSFFPTPRCLFSTPSLCFSLPSSLSALVSITPIRSTITLRFQWQRFISIFLEFPAGCQMFSYWIVRMFFPAGFFFHSRKQLRSILSARKFASTAPLIALRDPAQTMPLLFHDRQIVRLAEKVRNCALQRREIASTSRMLRTLSRSMWNRWRAIGLVAHSSDHLETSLFHRCFLHLIYTENIRCAMRCRCFPLVADVFLCKYCCASWGSIFSLLFLK